MIGNIERVANLFVTKSVYAAAAGDLRRVHTLPFPFFPRHLTIISSLTIGIPAFFLALAPNDRRTRPGFVRGSRAFAVPAGTVAAVAAFSGYAIAGQEAVSLVQERTCAVIVFLLVALWVLVILARPLPRWKMVLVAAMAALSPLAFVVPAARDFFELRLPPVLAIASSWCSARPLPRPSRCSPGSPPGSPTRAARQVSSRGRPAGCRRTPGRGPDRGARATPSWNRRHGLCPRGRRSMWACTAWDRKRLTWA